MQISFVLFELGATVSDWLRLLLSWQPMKDLASWFDAEFV